MDGNKDDALKCLKIGKQALESGDRNRALKFLIKAQRLDPTLPVEELLSSIGNDDSAFQTAAPTPDMRSGASSPKSSDQPSTRRRVSTNESSSTYTEQHIAVVREIRRKSNYYDILGVEKSCTVEDVRKAYRKLSLKVHPDKNKAPGSEEAFKSVSKAFQCLSNEENRKKYDLAGEDETLFEGRAATTRQGPRAYHYYEGDIDAEEIFRNFFFGGGRMAPATPFGGFNFVPEMGPRQGGGGGGGGDGSGGFNLRSLIQLLPVLLILLVNFLPSSEPIYSLARSYPYEHRFITPKGVNYYVKSTKFDEDYPVDSPERRTIEQKVESEYFIILRQNCQLEVQRRRWGYIQEMPHCDMLRKFDASAF